MALTHVDEVSAWLAAAHLPAATLHEAQGREGDLPGIIKPVWPGATVCGPAFPVRCPPGSNLHIHYALRAAAAGQVLVVDVGGGLDYGYWGEVLSTAAQARGLGGLVIHGSVRDRDELVRIGFPVFATGLCIRGTVKQPTEGSVGEPVVLGRVTVRHGDLVVGDADGVVVVPFEQVSEVVTDARAREAKERGFVRELQAGASTIDLFDFPPLQT